MPTYTGEEFRSCPSSSLEGATPGSPPGFSVQYVIASCVSWVSQSLIGPGSGFSGSGTKVANEERAHFSSQTGGIFCKELHPDKDRSAGVKTNLSKRVRL